MHAEFDIDLGLYFQWAGYPSQCHFEPDELKNFVQAALAKYQSDTDNDATEVTEPKERCCRIRFAPDFHIDTPCYHLDPERDARCLATETKGWEEERPEGHVRVVQGVPARRSLSCQVATDSPLPENVVVTKDYRSREAFVDFMTVLAAEAFDRSI